MSAVEPAMTDPQPNASLRARFRQERLEKPTQFFALIAQLTSLVVSIASLFLTVAGLVFVYFQVMNVKEQITGLHDTLDLQSYSAINAQMSEIDKVFIDHPELRPYFYKGQPWPKDNALLKNELISVAERKLDFIDFWFTSAFHLNFVEYDMTSWRTYFLNSFKNSQVLCDVLTDEQDEYGEQLRSIAYKSGKCATVKPVDPKSLDTIEDYFPGRTVFVPKHS